MHGGNLHVHYADAPEQVSGADAKHTAKMLKSNFDMYPKQTDKDTFTAPAKRTRDHQNQFGTSADLYWNRQDQAVAKKGTSIKTSELVGSNAVNYVDLDTLKAEAKDTKLKRAFDLGDIHGGRGVKECIGGYRDNDKRAGVVDTKISKPNMEGYVPAQRVVKASSNVSWAHGKGQPLTLQ